MSPFKFSLLLAGAFAFAGCAPLGSDESSGEDEAAIDADDEVSMPCPQTGCPGVCAIAGIDGPAFYAKNFATKKAANAWLAEFPSDTDKDVVAGPCDATVACPDYYDPFCGTVSGGEQQTFGNACELLAATRHAAGSYPPGGAKGVFEYDGECAAPDQCEGQPCGTPCEGPWANALPTACDGNGSCVPQPTCEEVYDCDLSHAACLMPIPECKDGETVSAVGLCYGGCVPITSCECDPADPNDCPQGSVCHANTGRCGPYVTE